MKPQAQVYTTIQPLSCVSAALWSTVFILIASDCRAQEKPKSPALHPSFHERLTGAEYEKRFAAAATGLKEASVLALAQRPAVGLVIKQVQEGSPAHQLGIRTGDLAARINGVALWSALAFRVEGRRSLEFYSASAKKQKTAKLPQGKVGIKTVEYWRPEWSYLRSKSMAPDWNAEAFVGITTASTDPDLAESAWWHAFRKGFKPDTYSAVAGLEIALARGDLQLGDDCAKYVRSFEGPQEDVVHPVLLFRVAMAQGQLQEMLRVVEKYPTVFVAESADIRHLISLQTQNPHDEQLRASADKYIRDDQIPRLLGYWHNDVEFSLSALQRKEALTVSASPGHWDALVVSPSEATPNVDVSLKFSWEPRDDNEGEFHSNIDIALIDNQSPRYAFTGSSDTERVIVGFSIIQSPSGVIESGEQAADIRGKLRHFLAKDSIQFIDQSLKPGPQSTYELRLLKIGGQSELFLNGHRLISIPVDPSIHQLALRLSTTASEVVIHEFHFDELVEDATK